MYEVLGQKGVCDLLETYVVAVNTDNNETLKLIRTEEVFEDADSNHLQWVECQCPSTGTNYMLGVEPHFDCPKEAMASLWGLQKQDYQIIQHT